VLTEISLPAASSLRVCVPPECYPTKSSRQASARQHLSWASVSLQHIRNRGSTSRRPYPPASVRLQGLATLLTVYAPRIRAGFVSHRQRSWDSPFGASPPAWYPRITARMPPPTVGLRLRCRRNDSRTRKPRFLGFDPRRGFHPGPHVFSTPTDGRSLGFRPSRVRPRKPCRDFARTPLTRFAQPALYERTLPASQSLNRFPAGSAVTHAAEFGGRRG
jgi:hypothetical protein